MYNNPFYFAPQETPNYYQGQGQEMYQGGEANDEYGTINPKTGQYSAGKAPNDNLSAIQNYQLQPAADVAKTGFKPDAGQIVSGVTGAADLLTSGIGMANQKLDLSLGADMQRDAYGKPVYTGGSNVIKVASAKPQGATGGEVLGMAAKGAAAGAAFGGVGALVGGAVGAIGGLIGGRARKRKQARAKRKAQRQVTAGQLDYNEASQQYDQQQASMQDYQRRRNNTNRLNNLYSIPQTIGY